MRRARQEIRLILFVYAIHELIVCCPPEPIGNCYSGSILLTSSYTGGITSRRCSETINKEWCAVSYYASGNTANFGCANDFAVPFGSMTCGDGPGFINTQGCSMANTPSGPCFFCCCRGGSCNHPAVFAREAARLPTFPQGFPPGPPPVLPQVVPPVFFGGAQNLPCSIFIVLLIPSFISLWL